MNQNQKDELSAWWNTAVGKAAMDATKAKFKAKRDANKQKRKGGGGNTGGADEKAKGADISATRKCRRNSKRLL